MVKSPEGVLAFLEGELKHPLGETEAKMLAIFMHVARIYDPDNAQHRSRHQARACWGGVSVCVCVWTGSVEASVSLHS